MKFSFALAALPLLHVCPASAAEQGCTQLEGYASETVTDYLDSWKNMHLAYKQFKHCDDGAVGEGFSDAAARLMANHWADLAQGRPILTADPDFEAWTIRHLDDTDNYDDLQKIDHLAQTACPIDATEFCGKVHTHIQSLEKQ
jgi:hypothetical protein